MNEKKKSDLAVLLDYAGSYKGLTFLGLALSGIAMILGMGPYEKQHDTVRNTNAHFRSGTDSAEEIAVLVDGIRLIEEHSFNEEMKKYSIRSKIFAALVPKANDRWATFEF